MQKHIHILATDKATGISLAHYIDSDNIFAVVDNKLYNIIDYRPINGNGKRLYSDSQTAIVRTIDKARAVLDQFNAEAIYLINCFYVDN